MPACYIYCGPLLWPPHSPASAQTRRHVHQPHPTVRIIPCVRASSPLLRHQVSPSVPAGYCMPYVCSPPVSSHTTSLQHFLPVPASSRAGASSAVVRAWGAFKYRQVGAPISYSPMPLLLPNSNGDNYRELARVVAACDGLDVTRRTLVFVLDIQFCAYWCQHCWCQGPTNTCIHTGVCEGMHRGRARKCADIAASLNPKVRFVGSVRGAKYCHHSRIGRTHVLDVDRYMIPSRIAVQARLLFLKLYTERPLRFWHVRRCCTRSSSEVGVILTRAACMRGLSHS